MYIFSPHRETERESPFRHLRENMSSRVKVCVFNSRYEIKICVQTTIIQAIDVLICICPRAGFKHLHIHPGNLGSFTLIRLTKVFCVKNTESPPFSIGLNSAFNSGR